MLYDFDIWVKTIQQQNYCGNDEPCFNYYFTNF